MKYIKSTLQFLFILDKGKRLLYMFLMLVPASIIVSLVFPLDIYIKWIVNYDVPYESFSLLWSSLLPSTLRVDLFILALLLVVISYSAISTLTLRCFRVGVFNAKGYLRAANDNFFPAFYLISSVIIFYVFWQFVLALFLYLFQTFNSVLLTVIFSSILMIIWAIGLIFLLVPVIVWFPIMAINGVSPFKALGIAIQKVNPKTLSIAFSIAFIIAAIILINILSGFLNFNFVSIIINTLTFSFGFCYIVVLSMIVYFDIEGLSREDISRSLYFSR